MKSTRKIILLAALFAVSLFTACERRSIEDGFEDTALIPVRIDWSLSGVSVEEMHRASVWLFPLDGGVPLQYRLESDLTYREIAVPVGAYSALVFNETVDESDWNSIAFTGTDQYETFAAMSVPQSAIGFYARSPELPLIGNPEDIAAWSLDFFEVTPDMIVSTRSLSGNQSALEEKAPYLTVVQPLPRFERVAITAYVTHLKTAKQATGTIDGMYSGVYMVSGERISEPAVQAFMLNGRVYDANGYDGTTSRTFNIFGRIPETKHQLAVDFLLSNNELHPREEFDVTHLIVTENLEHVRTHIIHIGYGNLPGDHVITLPEGDMETGFIVEEWEDLIIPIK